MIKKLISISKIEVLEDRRDLTSLDKVIEWIFDNLRSIDNIKSSHYKKEDFEKIIFDFVKNEHLIYIALNSKYQREIKSIVAVEKFNNEIKIVEESLEIYNKECSSIFDKKFTLVFRHFLNKFSDKLINYTNGNPSLDDKKQVFENLLNEIKQEKLIDLGEFIKAIDKFRE